MTGIFLLDDTRENKCAPILRQYLTKEKQNRFFLCQGPCLSLHIPKGILLPGSSCFGKKLELSGEFWCVFCSHHKEAAAFSRERGLRAVTCGFSPYDTVTLSSSTGEQSVVTLQREIHTVEGNLLEPADYPVLLTEPRSGEDVLISAAVLLLLGVMEGQDHFIF